jgi:hypothetical protein
MKTRAVTICISLATLFLGFISGYRRGKEDVTAEEFHTYDADLIVYTGFKEYRELPLKEFLKARYYYFANRIPSSSLKSAYDYGSVDFKGLSIGAGPTSPIHEYQMFKLKHITFKKASDT